MILGKDETEVNFLHIPRTAGRYVANLLTESGYEYTSTFPGSGHRTIFFEGKELLHLNLQEENNLIKLCKIKTPDVRFTVIRDPVEKFISFSAVFESHIKLLGLSWKDMENPTNFHEVMENVGFISGGEDGSLHLTMGLKRLNSNAYIDQRQYIDNTVKVWRFEDGLGENFVEWLNSMGMSVEFKPVEYKTKSFDKHKTDFSDNMKDVIYNYFKPECEALGYAR